MSGNALRQSIKKQAGTVELIRVERKECATYNMSDYLILSCILWFGFAPGVLPGNLYIWKTDISSYVKELP